MWLFDSAMFSEKMFYTIKTVFHNGAIIFKEKDLKFRRRAFVPDLNFEPMVRKSIQ